MAYDPIYTHEDYLFQEITIKGKTLNQLATEHKVTRSCIYTYVKKFKIKAEEFIVDLNEFQALKKIRREYYEKFDKGEIKEVAEKPESKYKIIERKVPHPEGGMRHVVLETDYDWSEDELATVFG